MGSEMCIRDRFYDVSNRSNRYLEEGLGHENLSDLKIFDAGRFRDYLFARDMSSSSGKRVLSSVKSIFNLAIKEQGLSITNVLAAHSFQVMVQNNAEILFYQTCFDVYG